MLVLYFLFFFKPYQYLIVFVISGGNLRDEGDDIAAAVREEIGYGLWVGIGYSSLYSPD